MFQEFRMQKSYENFSHKHFEKDQDTLIEQSILQIIQKYLTQNLFE